MGIYKINDPSLERTLKAIRDDDILLNELNAEFRHFKSKDKNINLMHILLWDVGSMNQD